MPSNDPSQAVMQWAATLTLPGGAVYDLRGILKRSQDPDGTNTPSAGDLCYSNLAGYERASAPR